MATAKTRKKSPRATLRAYKNKVSAQVRKAKLKLERIEAKARARIKEKHLEAKIAKARTEVVRGLKSANKKLDSKIRALERHPQVARAKAKIESDISKFKRSVHRLAAKF